MKTKVIHLILLICCLNLVFLLVNNAVAIADSTSTVVTETPMPPAEPELPNPFLSFPVLILTIIVVSDYLNKMAFKVYGLGAQMLSLAISILIGVFGNYTKLGIFESTTYPEAILISFGAGLAANAIFPTPVIQFILKVIKSRNKEGKL